MSSDNSLSTNPGNQLQGINTQGISVNKDHIEVNIDWVDPTTNQYFDPTTYSVSVTKDGSPYTVEKVLVPLSRVDDSVGVWHYSFLTSGMTSGTYEFTFSGSTSTISTVTHTLSFTSAEIPVEQYFIGALRAKLWDKRASRYLIDDNQRTRWTDGELYSFVDDSRLRIGQEPPSPENLSWPVAFSEAHDLVLTGGFIGALEAAGIFSQWNKFNYSDELSLNVDRTPFFQNAQSLKQQWMLSIMRWKRDKQFHAVRGIGMRSGRFPMYYTRVMSLLPHMSRVFYG
jgi:hypothetical protein